MELTFPAGIKAMPLEFEPFRFANNKTDVSRAALIAIPGGKRDWDDVAAVLSQKLSPDRFSYLRPVDHWDAPKDALLPADHTLFWVYFADAQSCTDAILASKLEGGIKVLPMLHESDAPYYVFPMESLPFDSMENATRTISEGFKLLEEHPENPNWGLYMGTTPSPLVKYNESATVIIRSSDAINKFPEVYGQHVTSQGPFYMLCGTCKVLGDHNDHQCPFVQDDMYINPIKLQ